MSESAEVVVRWDDIPSRMVAVGDIAAEWSDLGKAAGTVDTGVRRIRVVPGKRSTPVHTHAGEEEIFFVLSGSGLSHQGDVAHDVRAGDCIVHHPKGPAHTLVAGEEGLDTLAFSDRRPPESAYLPRAGLAWLGSTWVKVGEGPHPFAQEAAVGSLDIPDPQPRPDGIKNRDEVEPRVGGRGAFRRVEWDLGLAAGSRRIGLQYVRLEQGMQSYPLHCHTCEEEVFVVLDGRATLILDGEEHDLKRGDMVARPSGRALSHAIRGGEGGVEYLAFGERDPADVVWYPTSRKLHVRGLKVIFRVEPVGYWDGEA